MPLWHSPAGPTLPRFLQPFRARAAGQHPKQRTHTHSHHPFPSSDNCNCNAVCDPQTNLTCCCFKLSVRIIWLPSLPSAVTYHLPTPVDLAIFAPQSPLLLPHCRFTTTRQQLFRQGPPKPAPSRIDAISEQALAREAAPSRIAGSTSYGSPSLQTSAQPSPAQPESPDLAHDRAGCLVRIFSSGRQVGRSATSLGRLPGASQAQVCPFFPPRPASFTCLSSSAIITREPVLFGAAFHNRSELGCFPCRRGLGLHVTPFSPPPFVPLVPSPPPFADGRADVCGRESTWLVVVSSSPINEAW